MNTLILTIHIIACISLVTLVLMQSGHEGMGVIFGGSSSSFFGSSGAGGLLAKLTIAMAIIFFLTSLGFTYIDSMKKQSSQESVVFEKKEEAPKKASQVPSGVKTEDKKQENSAGQTK